VPVLIPTTERVLTAAFRRDEKVKAALNYISCELATCCPAYSERVPVEKLNRIAVDQIAEELTDLIIQFAEDRLDEIGEAIVEQVER